MDFMIGGVAAMSAVIFSNPLDVVKTRMQLQGELQFRGHYAVHYRSVPHAIYMITKNDGILALQKGLLPAVGFQLVCNSTRLGIYQTAESHQLTKNSRGETDTLKSIFFGSVAGVTGAYFGSPFYLLKTQIQSKSSQSIAVGYQHDYRGSWHAVESIVRSSGLSGLMRGWQSSVLRAGVGSPVQLTTFTKSKDMLKRNNVLVDSPILAAFVASNISGVAVVMVMCPIDCMSTRIYNQDTDALGRGKTYSGIIDCGVKIVKSEGFLGLYKGVGPLYLRLAPHTVLCLIFWDYLKNFVKKIEKQNA